MAAPQTLFEKIWSRHEIASLGDRSLLFVDRNFVHEGSVHAFAALAEAGRPVRRPDLTVAVADHYVPTAGRPAIADPAIRGMVDALSANARAHGLLHIGMDDPRQGIVHVIGPELGLSLPGQFIVCNDSHVSTHGALGALTWALGTSDLKHVLATQALWLRRPKTMRVCIGGALDPGVTAKDLALAIIAHIGANGAAGHVFEFAGEAIDALSIEGRLTLCNMSIEAGARAGLVAPDETTLAYLAGRPYAPAGAAWNAALLSWSDLHSDSGAAFDRDLAFDAGVVAPMVTWGTSPEDCVAIDARVPDPSLLLDPERRDAKTRALRYMGLQPGTPMTEIAVDRVFIGSCTNARIEDLREAAQVFRGRRAVVPTLVVPGSHQVQVQAESEGLDGVFRAAGAEWREPGCSMCVGVNGDLLAPSQRCASTSNRNFEGRQGIGGRTHLVSPAMAAAASVSGHFVDVRAIGAS
jgi:3-isopropylmalate/(R)-2-methylmalate dehydratase large subunit